jgi:hypothetical protein
MRTIRYLPYLGWLPAMVVLSGCGVPGHWASTMFEPESARDEFRLVGDTTPGLAFTRATLILNDDTTYSAEAYYGDRMERSTGKWELADETLTLVDSRGPTQTYKVDLEASGQRLELVRPIQGTDVKLVMKRAS